MSRCTRTSIGDPHPLRPAHSRREGSRSGDALRRLGAAGLAGLLCMNHAVTAGDTLWSGLGRTATLAEIAAWDIDVKPDGTGLPKGRGSVAEGEALYEARCASCHGAFGESNQYTQLAGGVGTLASDAPVRTTGSKLNYATTLWDYINRAMPFQAPKSLTANEVYALTAYVLHLNEIVPADATLDEQSILQVNMPNRDGFVTDHGFMRADGEPDVQTQACMKDCAVDGRIVSSIPAHARDAHGNLTQQFRAVGPYRGANTARPEPVGVLAAAKQARAAGAGGMPQAARSAAELARQYACTACHGIDQKVVGPGFREVAHKYMGDAGARALLLAKVRNGGSGVWGAIPMPAQPQVDESDLSVIVDWVLGGAK
jgi:cytochrome c